MSSERLTKEQILYEDAYIIAVDKPAGLMVEPDAHGHPNLVQEIERIMQHKPKIKSGLGVVHRLDRVVSGVIVFAKTPMALKSLNEQIANRKVKKIYHAWVEGQLEGKSGKWDMPLGRSFDRKRASKEGLELKAATTFWKVLNFEGNRTMLELDLKTGRFHQIRAHCAFNGHPIVGDTSYGSTHSYTGNSIALHSFSYTFTHPKSGEKMTITSNNYGN
ncbi:MAG: RluA family pseudouridine synthase [Flavobacteriia bacterium]|nr:RluA family pseudouridine synthase [Flavobacteriia bacterium]